MKHRQIMKKIIYLAICALALTFAACEYDNYDEPGSRFSGRILYNGEQLGFGYNEVYIELWEQGNWQLKEAIRVNVNIDGTFSQVLFDGDYKMVIPKSARPFLVEQDTVLLKIRGSKEMDIEVTPYYTIENVKYKYNAADDKLEYVGKTAYLYQGSQINWHTLNTQNNPGGSLDNVIFSGPAVNSSKLPTAQNYIFGRVAVQVNGISPMLMPHPKKITFR